MSSYLILHTKCVLRKQFQEDVENTIIFSDSVINEKWNMYSNLFTASPSSLI